jgi:hypothetical protein
VDGKKDNRQLGNFLSEVVIHSKAPCMDNFKQICSWTKIFLVGWAESKDVCLVDRHRM